MCYDPLSARITARLAILRALRASRFRENDQSFNLEALRAGSGSGRGGAVDAA